MLEDVPVYTGLKTRAEDNNHQGDAKAYLDKMLKAQQQRLINMTRIMATLYGGITSPDYQVLAQQMFYYLLESENQILTERKKRSIPGSTVSSTNVLFTAEDLRHDKQVAQINAAGGKPVRRCT